MANLKSIQQFEHLVTEYLCPECRSPMTSGIEEPNSDGSDWIYVPHCSECEFEAQDAKRPYQDCIPAEYRREVKKMGAYVAPVDRNENSAHVQVSNYFSLPHSRPGSMWVGFLPLIEVERKPEESERQFWDRAWQEASEEVEKIAGPIEIGHVESRIFEDSRFYRF